jgi:hypothetical protein
MRLGCRRITQLDSSRITEIYVVKIAGRKKGSGIYLSVITTVHSATIYQTPFMSSTIKITTHLQQNEAESRLQNLAPPHRADACDCVVGMAQGCSRCTGHDGEEGLRSYQRAAGGFVVEGKHQLRRLSSRSLKRLKAALQGRRAS